MGVATIGAVTVKCRLQTADCIYCKGSLDCLMCLVDEYKIKGIPPGEIAVVIDKDLAHTTAERIMDYRNGVQVICLGPYSLALNGI